MDPKLLQHIQARSAQEKKHNESFINKMRRFGGNISDVFGQGKRIYKALDTATSTYDYGNLK